MNTIFDFIIKILRANSAGYVFIILHYEMNILLYYTHPGKFNFITDVM